MTTTPGQPDRDTPCCDGPYCHGKKRGEDGGWCHRPEGWGTDHAGTGRCKLHGGATQTHKAAAKAEAARRAVATYGLPREVDPAVALLEEVHRTAGHVTWLAEVVGDLGQDDLVWSVAEEVDRIGGIAAGSETTHKAAPSVWLDLYQRERKHLTDVCKTAIAAGIAERQVRLAEQQGAIVVDVIRRILDRLSLTAEQAALVPQVVPEELRRAAVMN
ncbi:hypothetical protein GCM10017673_56600 [Streptosporangium violaceochromogenes]|nr:hypothetical protein GCM10017673_56600 [Streptosporangium violaceochromogenes]